MYLEFQRTVSRLLSKICAVDGVLHMCTALNFATVLGGTWKRADISGRRERYGRASAEKEKWLKTGSEEHGG